jgi:hypothetical protein
MLGVMSSMKSITLAFTAALFALPVHAQSTRYDVKTINFDLWCQEQAKLPPDRCDKRLPADDAAFESYRAKIEKYEIPYLERKDHEEQLDRTVMHADPTRDPVTDDNLRQGQTPAPQR